MQHFYVNDYVSGYANNLTKITPLLVVCQTTIPASHLKIYSLANRHVLRLKTTILVLTASAKGI